MGGGLGWVARCTSFEVLRLSFSVLSVAFSMVSRVDCSVACDLQLLTRDW